MRLIRWCQFIMPEDVNVLTAETEVRNLVALGLIRQHERSGALIMSKKGVLLLKIKVRFASENRAVWLEKAVSSKEEYQPPPLDVPVWDAIYRDRPLVIAADMDLRRLDAAIQAARGVGLQFGEDVFVTLAGKDKGPLCI